MSSHEHDDATALATLPDDPNTYVNPGFGEHGHRLTDIDPVAEKRAERLVAGMFVLSMIGTLWFIVAFFVFKPTDSIADIQLSNQMLGLGIMLSMLGIGLGAVLWAKNLMPDAEVIEDRHSIAASDETQAIALEILRQGNEESGIGRRPLIRNTLLASLALVPLPAVLAFRDLGPLPGKRMHETLWANGVRLTKDTGGVPESPEPIKASDVTIGSAFHVIPENLASSEHRLEEKAKAAVLLMRLNPNDLKFDGADDPSREWNYQGIIAYSKVCTHVGCPVALYEHQTHHLLCPCHQSTFDVTDHAKVIFGPAKRPLPQLPITVDNEGYLIATSDFPDPVGASFWELNDK